MEDDLPYRTAPIHRQPKVTPVTMDEQEYSTLKQVQAILYQAVADLDKWSAFDTEEKELKLKQQIVAHRMSFEVLAPVLDAVNAAMQLVDDKFKQGR